MGFGIFLIICAAYLAIPLALVQRPSDRSVAAFAKVYDVTLTSGNVALLRSYIWWTRRWRVGGAVAAIIAVAVVQVLRGDRSAWQWESLVTGYGIGAIVGEFARPRRTVAGATAKASLERRSIGHYVTRAFLVPASMVALGALVGAVALITSSRTVSGWFLTAPSTTSPLTGPFRVGRWYVLSAAAAVVLIGSVAWLTARSLARSSVPADSADRMAVHHGIRSAAIISLAGAAVMLIGGIGAQLGFQATLIDGDLPRSAQILITLSALWCTLAVLWGGLMTWNAVPRFALLAGRLPTVPRREAS